MRALLPMVTACLVMAFAAAAPAQSARLIDQEMLLAYLDALTQWQRDTASLEPSTGSAREVVFRDNARENAAKALQSGFVFLRTFADNTPAVAVDPESTRQKLTLQAKEIERRIAALQRGPRTQATADALRLSRARLELTQTILANLNMASNKSPDKLSYTINSLARSIPEANSGVPATAPAAKAAEGATIRRSPTSILGLSAALFETERKQREIDAAVAASSELKNTSMELMKALRNGLQETTAAAGAQEEAGHDGASQPAAPPLTVDEQVEAYRQIGANIVPLAESMRWIDVTRQTLKEWGGVLEQRRSTNLRQLAIQAGILLAMLLVAYAVSEMVRRSLKSLKDAKRKRQLNTVRRILFGVTVLVIVLFNFISDFTSFATFAGFLTAGLAVALQSVLLSLVAHFLFYGRYGIRNGDRVHVAGVTGDIVQIGMVRFYLRELQETKKGELEPTGKIVAFPNSIVFQNLAFYKYA